MASGPTQRSLQYLRDRGYVVAVVERWNPHARIRQDLYGWIDLLAFDPETGWVLAVQTTSGSNVSKRIAKIREWPHLAGWLKRNGAVVHGWAKRGPRGKRKVWTCREVAIEAEGSTSELEQE